jgi:hypothetical protein
MKRYITGAWLFLLFLILILFVCPAYAYKVILKSGKTIEGKLLSEDNQTIRILDASGVQISFKKGQVDLAATATANAGAAVEPGAAGQSAAVASPAVTANQPTVKTEQGSWENVRSSLPWDSFFFASQPQAIVSAIAKLPTVSSEVRILLDETVLEYRDDGARTKTIRQVYQVLSSNAIEDWSSVSHDYSPWHEDKPQLRARVITRDGQVHLLDPATIDDAPAEDLAEDVYTDDRVVQAPLPAVAQGSVVEFEFVVREHHPLFPYGNVERHYFGEFFPVNLARLVVSYPQNLQVRYASYLLPNLNIHRMDRQNRTSLIFEQQQMEPVESAEANLPADVPGWPAVALSTGISWQEVAAAYGSIIDQRISQSDLRGWIGQTIRKGESIQTTGGKLLSKLHQTVRYTGVEFGQASIVPANPEEVLNRKYGDCKDQASLLVQMLRQSGIPAYVALLRPAPGWDIEKDLPGLGLFTHAIVYVPGKPEYWIDPTDELAGFGVLPVMDQGRWALVAAPGSVGLLKTPSLQAEENVLLEVRTFTLPEIGKAHVFEVTKTTGAIGLDYRHDYEGSDPKDIQTGLDDYAKDEYLALTPVHYHTTDPSNLSEPFQLTIDVERARRGGTYDDRAVVGIMRNSILERLPYVFQKQSDEQDDASEEEKREQPYVFRELFTHHIQYKVIPPPSYTIQDLPPDLQLDFGPVQYNQKFIENADKSVNADLTLRVTKPMISPQEYETLHTKVLDFLNEPAILLSFAQDGMAHLDRGEIRDALSEFRKLETLHPKEGLHKAQVALALLSGGMGEEARMEADRSLQLDPTSAFAYRTRGWILEHDLIGRQFGFGFDREAALASYRKAKSLDPQDETTRAQLADLLEHDADGKMYTRESNLKEAVAEYQSLIADLKKETYKENLLFDYFWLDDLKALKEAAKDMEHTGARNEFWIAATAVVDGVDAARREAASLFPEAAARRNKLEAASGDLALLRHYSESLALLSEASKGATDAGDLFTRVDLLKRYQRHEEMRMDPHDPATVIKKLFLAMMLTKGAVKELEGFFANDVQKDFLDPEEAGAFAKGFRKGWKSAVGKQGMSLAFLIDSFFAGCDFSVKGDETTGYEVSITSRLKQAAAALNHDFYVTMENGEYKILGADWAADLLGIEIQRLVDGGRLEIAKSWLNDLAESHDYSSASDPFAADPFQYFWTRNAQAEPQKMKLAAATLLLRGNHCDRAVSLYERARAEARAEDRSLYSLPLLIGYMKIKRYEEALHLIDEMLLRKPDSETLFLHRVQALKNLKKYADVKMVCEERQKSDPKDPVALHALADLAMETGNTEAAKKIYRQIIDQGDSSSSAYNQLSWLVLFEKMPVNDDDISLAQEAVSRAYLASVALHTLASLYAEQGKTTEAYQTILKSIGQLEEPRDYDWYVFGRIAEQYGLRDQAVRAYKRVTLHSDDTEPAYSTYALAEKRLALLAHKE